MYEEFDGISLSHFKFLITPIQNNDSISNQIEGEWKSLWIRQWNISADDNEWMDKWIFATKPFKILLRVQNGVNLFILRIQYTSEADYYYIQKRIYYHESI